MPFADSGGVKLYYEVMGEGVPMLMIEGYGQYSQQWGQLPYEFARQYKVITLDNRGVGRSDKPDEPLTMAKMADDTCRVLDELSIKQANVFGVSMGGMIAQEFALNHADRVINLILGCTYCGGPHSVKPPPEGLKILFDYEYLRNMKLEQRNLEIFRFFCTDEFIEAQPEAFQQYNKVTNEYPTPLYTFRRQAEAVYKFDTWERLPSLQVPTMIIHGTGDKIIPFENSQILEERIPGAELTLLQDKRHGFFIEAMDSTKIFINGFLKRRAAK